MMHIVHVFIHVKPESVEAFRRATIENARNSLREPGITRFDVIQQDDDPTKFALVEVYRSPDDPPKHRETAHYKAWVSAASEMMAEPRTRVIYHNVYPEDPAWG
jgi:quinol monooxygenase YgiN